MFEQTTRREPYDIANLPERVATKIGFGDSDECWLWTAATNGFGYGLVKWNAKSMSVAHRVVYELLVGPIPEGLDLDHLCHNAAVDAGECLDVSECQHRRCVNPSHLEPVTRTVNSRRGDAGGYQSRKTHCPNGHPYSGENLYVVPTSDGTNNRHCRECIRVAGRRYYARQKASREAGNR